MSEPPPSQGWPSQGWARRIVAAQRTRLAAYRRSNLTWRVLVPSVFTLAGFLFATSAVSSDGTDLRAGRYGDLESVVQQQKEEADALRLKASRLAEEVAEMAEGLDDTRRADSQRRVDELSPPTGLQAVEGPGVTIELDDAPDEVIARSDKPGQLVVHQQDIQAVANALWAGGAEAMTIQGQRVISTTGIKCIGNTVVLHGIPYSPPYVITAIGDVGAMMSAVNDSVYVDTYLEFVAESQLGWDVLPHTLVRLPAYEGTLDLEYARHAGRRDDTDDEL